MPAEGSLLERLFARNAFFMQFPSSHSIARMFKHHRQAGTFSLSACAYRPRTTQRAKPSRTIRNHDPRHERIGRQAGHHPPTFPINVANPCAIQMHPILRHDQEGQPDAGLHLRLHQRGNRHRYSFLGHGNVSHLLPWIS